MLIVPRGESKRWVGYRRARLLMGAFGAVVALGAACSEDDEPAKPAVCLDAAASGLVAGPESTHCVAEGGSAIVQVIGACVSGGEAEEEHEHEEGAADAGETHEHDEEEHEPNFGSAADDDDCKYRVSFTNTCVAVNQPVSFTLSLTRKFDGQPGAGTNPAFPEVFLENDPTHISPSNDITANEGRDGTYDIGPIVFDAPGRWVIRFHYFESCSDVVEDSPHGHAAFYIDVP
jgi:hypothetical protein